MTPSSSRLRGLAATLALVAFVVGVPLVLLAIGAVPDPAALSWARLTAPDDGTVVLQILAAVCWIAWAIFTCQLAVSIVAKVRGIRAPRLPGLALPQIAADRLVAAAALMFVAVPAAAAVLPQPKAQAAVSSAPLPDVAPVAAPLAPVTPVPAAEENPERRVERYTVKRGDSLWRIAEDRLGDGARYVELVELNKAVLDGRPDFLLPGTVLRVPVVEPSDTYVVKPGDTLSAIAEDELGDARAYPAIFEESDHTVQADGRQLTDPDLILPGWRLTIPGNETADEAVHETTQPRHVKARVQADPSPQTPPSDVTQSEPTGPSAEPSKSSADGETALPSWLVPGLVAAGSIFGAALWLVLRAQRRTQLRHRRPGMIIPPAPQELVPIEKTARATASAVAPQIDALDSALRSLPTGLRLVAATLGSDEVELTIEDAADLPAPWHGSGTGWRISLADVPQRPEDSFPPFPLLVSVGQAEDGSFLFLNLEELRIVTVTGGADRKAAFARHVAAELAVNPWSIVTTVELLGLGSDLASFNLGRVRTHPAGDTDFIAALARNLPSPSESVDPDDFHAAIIATTDRPAAEVEDLAAAISAVPGRSSAALVDLAGEPWHSGVHLELGADGHLRAESLGVDVIAAGLSDEEARACARLLDFTLDDTAVPVPQSDDGAAITDVGGALIERLTEQRGEGPAGVNSLLPHDAQVYADAAATTVDDIEALAPRATPEAKAATEATDPTLDEDLARWESPTLSSAKLTLLGPVGARTTGDAKATAHRRPFYVELLAYLALHPKGVTGAAVADAFGLRPERVRVDMSQLRRWLGNDPRTGKPHLPNAEPGPGPDSPAVYKLDGVLSDLDLFRRLRARGQSRGAGGMEDLISALRLVSGEPFTELRGGHWNWLLDGDRWDHIMSSAIVDVGHVVTTHALASGDRDLALWAAQVAYTAAPYDEVAQLDMIEAEKSVGNDEMAESHLRDRVISRRDDDLPPIDLPKRTAQIIEEKGWDVRARRPRRTG